VVLDDNMASIRIIAGTGGGLLVAECYGDSGDSGPNISEEAMEANAALIAAAPELYEAALRLVASHDGRMGKCECGECTPFHAVIAKVRGAP
jgi:hypothetical protein